MDDSPLPKDIERDVQYEKGLDGDGYQCKLKIDFDDQTVKPSAKRSFQFPWRLTGTELAEAKGREVAYENDKRTRHQESWLRRLEIDLGRRGEALHRTAGGLVLRNVDSAEREDVEMP